MVAMIKENLAIVQGKIALSNIYRLRVRLRLVNQALPVLCSVINVGFAGALCFRF